MQIHFQPLKGVDHEYTGRVCNSTFPAHNLYKILSSFALGAIFISPLLGLAYAVHHQKNPVSHHLLLNYDIFSEPNGHMKKKSIDALHSDSDVYSPQAMRPIKARQHSPLS